VGRTRLRGVVVLTAAAVVVSGVGMGLAVSMGRPSATAAAPSAAEAAMSAAVFSTSAEAVQWERAYLGDLRVKRRAQEQMTRAKAAKDRAAWAARQRAARARAARAKAARLAVRLAAARASARKAAAGGGGSPKAVARRMLAARGMDSGQFSCLDKLWTRESGWRVTARNPSSGAYGIPQALPGAKMASVGADWRTNAATQIRWGLGYIDSRYGTPCRAWRNAQRFGWY
jgi:hypothetical protein